jgi:hypothetical protein
MESHVLLSTYALSSWALSRMSSTNSRKQPHDIKVVALPLILKLSSLALSQLSSCSRVKGNVARQLRIKAPQVYPSQGFGFEAPSSFPLKRRITDVLDSQIQIIHRTNFGEGDEAYELEERQVLLAFEEVGCGFDRGESLLKRRYSR